MEDFLRKFKAQFIESEKIEINKDTLFRKEVETYDSMTGMAIVVMIEDEYSVIIEDEDFRKLNTPEEVFLHITK